MSLVGKVIDERYQLQALLGRGGMGEVYAALDLSLDRRVALKLILEQFNGDGRYLRRFQREARSAASLNHPGIVRLYDFGTDGDAPYLSMELVEGFSLRERLAREGRLSVAEAVHLVRKVLEALDYAHARGVIHRDIKPGNIMVSIDGQVKLTDFGIARVLGDAAMTDSGMVFGTYSYLAPERAAGSQASPASDLYSVGCVLYELLAGEPPFSADTPVAVAIKHISEPPPALKRRRRRLPTGLEYVVERALAKEPEDRYRNAAAFSAALEQVDFAPGSPASVGTVLWAEEPTTVRPRSEPAQATVALDLEPSPTTSRPSTRRPPGRALSAAVFVVLLGLVLTAAVWALDSMDGPGSSDEGLIPAFESVDPAGVGTSAASSSTTEVAPGEAASAPEVDQSREAAGQDGPVPKKGKDPGRGQPEEKVGGGQPDKADSASDQGRNAQKGKKR